MAFFKYNLARFYDKFKDVRHKIIQTSSSFNISPTYRSLITHSSVSHDLKVLENMSEENTQYFSQLYKSAAWDQIHRAFIKFNQNHCDRLYINDIMRGLRQVSRSDFYDHMKLAELGLSPSKDRLPVCWPEKMLEYYICAQTTTENLLFGARDGFTGVRHAGNSVFNKPSNKPGLEIN